MFDNATTHQKRASDALSALKTPLRPKIWSPKTQTAKMRDGVLPNGDPQPLYWPLTHRSMPGYFKGMKQILLERGLWIDKLPAQCSPSFAACEGKIDCCARRILFNQPDFVAQKSKLQEMIEERGHQCDFYPKFHCELNFIEQYWGAAKYAYRAVPRPSTIAEMEETVKNSLDSVSLLQIKRSVDPQLCDILSLTCFQSYANRSARFMDAYRKGLNGAQASWANKKYHGHRTLPLAIMSEIPADYKL
jgi:hypothetical protein